MTALAHSVPQWQHSTELGAVVADDVAHVTRAEPVRDRGRLPTGTMVTAVTHDRRPIHWLAPAGVMVELGDTLVIELRERRP